MDFPTYSYGPAHEASEENLERDEHGFTNPNLHRRVDPQPPEEGSDELAPREYSLGLYGSNSYRTTTITTHSESATDSDIP